MERLTRKDAYGYVHHPWEFNGVNGSYDIFDEDLLEKQIDRLGAYEDTGLEPEQVMELKSFTQGGIHKVDDVWKHVQDLLQAEQAGRLVVLPCKVGDHVWADGREAIVVWFFGYKTERYLHAQFLDNAEYTDIPFCEIGKTVFLTREEAEAVLALKGGDG